MKVFQGIFRALIWVAVLGAVALLIVFLLSGRAHAQVVGIAPSQSASAENNHVFKAAPGTAFQISFTNSTSTAGFVQLFNLAAAPSSGSVLPAMCKAVAGNASVTFSFSEYRPALFTTGIVATVSSASTCTTYTTGTITGFFDGLVN